MDDAALRSKEQMQENLQIKLENRVGGDAGAPASKRDDVTMRCPHCGGECARKDIGMFWRKFGYSGSPYCQNCSARFRNHIIRQRSTVMKDCTRSCPCQVCGSILDSFVDKSPEGRKQAFQLMDSKRPRKTVAAASSTEEPRQGKRQAGIEIEMMVVNPAEAVVSVNEKKRKLSNCGGGVAVPLPLALVGLLSVVTLVVLISKEGLPAAAAPDESALVSGCVGHLRNDSCAMESHCLIDSHCHGSIGSVCIFRCQQSDGHLKRWVPRNQRTCTETGYQGGECAMIITPEPPVPHGEPTVPHVETRSWSSTCRKWQWVCADDEAHLPDCSGPACSGYRSWPRWSMSAGQDGEGPDDDGVCAYVCAGFGHPDGTELQAFCPYEYSACFSNSSAPRYDLAACDDDRAHPTDSSVGRHRRMGETSRKSDFKLPPGIRNNQGVLDAPPTVDCAAEYNCAVTKDTPPNTGMSVEYSKLLKCALHYPSQPNTESGGADGKNSMMQKFDDATNSVAGPLPEWTNICSKWKWNCGPADELRRIPAGWAWPAGMTSAKTWPMSSHDLTWPSDTGSAQSQERCCWQCQLGFQEEGFYRDATAKLSFTDVCPDEYAQCRHQCLAELHDALYEDSPFFRGPNRTLYQPDYLDLTDCVLNTDRNPPPSYNVSIGLDGDK